MKVTRFIMKLAWTLYLMLFWTTMAAIWFTVAVLSIASGGNSRNR